jgi:hypothetical protein
MVVVAHQQHQPAYGSRSRHRQAGFFRLSEFAFRGGETSASSKTSVDAVLGTELSPSSAHTTFVKPSLVFGGGVTNSSYKVRLSDLPQHNQIIILNSDVIFLFFNNYEMKFLNICVCVVSRNSDLAFHV